MRHDCLFSRIQVSNRFNASALLLAEQGDLIVDVAVRNVSEPPYFVSPLDASGYAFTFYENKTAGYFVGWLLFDEQDMGCNYTVSLLHQEGNPAAEYFSVDANGNVTLLQRVVYEVHPNFTLLVQANNTCTSEMVTVVDVSIGVIHLNKAPTLTCLASSVINVDEGFQVWRLVARWRSSWTALP